MKNWVFLSPIFWKVLWWGIIADWGSKALINLLIEPLQHPTPSIRELKGMVYPYPPGNFSIAHAEHWREYWYDLDGIFQFIYNLIVKFTPFEVPMVWFFLIIVLVFPLLISLYSIDKQRRQLRLVIGLAFWFAALIGNKGEVGLFGHATDWIWIKFSSFSVFTNLADLMIIVAIVALWGMRERKDNKEPSPSLQKTS